MKTHEDVMELLAQGEAAVEKGVAVECLVEPLQSAIESLGDVQGAPDDPHVLRCRLIELDLRRLRDRIMRVQGKQWIAAQLSKAN